MSVIRPAALNKRLNKEQPSLLHQSEWEQERQMGHQRLPHTSSLYLSHSLQLPISLFHSVYVFFLHHTLLLSCKCMRASRCRLCGGLVLNSTKGTITSQGLVFMKTNRLFTYLLFESHIKRVYRALYHPSNYNCPTVVASSTQHDH